MGKNRTNRMDSLEMKKPMQKDDMQMDHQTMTDTAATEGKVYKASEMGQDGMMMENMNMVPLGTSMTGYEQVQAAFPDETLPSVAAVSVMV